jgi:hypothetical protein
MEGKLRRKSKSVCYLDESTHAKTAETRQSTQLQTRPRIKYRLRQLECQSTEVGKSWPIPTSHTKRAAAPALESLGLRPETPRLFSPINTKTTLHPRTIHNIPFHALVRPCHCF